ncbi:UxaA family hydrolase [Agrobacterium vitis]|uniref:UxaA family hydrolase n=1 Tax=Agrobacterium vitis TaxID=373 RepID=UPI000872DE4F|nr:altronate dehydratase family protein [Agrobacterium vitis]MCE6077226.1 altronate dehydratase [Agrobacterium vitis]MCM2451146.1 altronate dehydratase [Agrobacterium vitis]MCM2470633.1 altronate dehydratase [Agrobacterium vitis]MUO71111.1 altronate dehydratase [Agrobacterium vitis]MUO85961.1 altronate dehydratase [Agrobacterium vitis]
MAEGTGTGTVLLHPDDTVAILTNPAPAGVQPLGFGAALDHPVTRGHKIARQDMEAGNNIIKFGQVIGYASRPIRAGEHVHTDNCSFGAHDQQYEVGADYQKALAAIPTVKPATFMGYRRANGQAGTRNFIAICATVNCSATVIRRAADDINRSGILNDYPNIDGVAAFAHGTGCGMDAGGEGADILQRVLWGYATHPNVGAAVFVGLGCEVMQLARMKMLYGGNDESRFFGLTIQDSGGTAATIAHLVEHIKSILPVVNAIERQPIPASELKLALQCGGSDGFSGITANPALGIASDLLVGLGGTVVLSETPEIYGAEQLLLRRAASSEIGEKLIARIRWWEDYTKMNRGSMDNNPSPGNKLGGLTTILEKSLGASAKAGSTPLTDVLNYAERIETPGFVFMDTPGYDPVSATGQIAGGAQMLVFTTGRGSAFGSKPTPTIKLATNSKLYEDMPDDMDLNCGDIISAGISVEQKGREILDLVLASASGQKTKSEILGLGDNEFVPWQVGAVM